MALMCVLAGEELVLGSFEPDEYQQRWKCQGNRMLHCEEEELVLDVADCCQDEGSRVCSWQYNGGDNQHWNFENM